MIFGATPPVAFLAALSALPGVGPARLALLVDGRSPAEAWRRVAQGEHWVAESFGFGLAEEWRTAARGIDPLAILAELRQLGARVAHLGSPLYPECLLDDPEPPAVLFMQGDPSAIGARRVAVVGTRRCTRYGLDVATELGHALAASGVTVVSGLALGIDAAAHRGALGARSTPPVAVVATGLDMPYPRRNESMWQEVARVGAVLSEAPPGVGPQKWRFPARNRVIAGLSELVVVVESREAGGSMYTVSEALRRDRLVGAVPGPVRSPASAGTNRLLAEGCQVVTSPDDVLSLLDMAGGAVRAPAPQPVTVMNADAEVLESFAWLPTTVDSIVIDLGRSFDDVASALARLTHLGLVVRSGPWYERCAVATTISDHTGPEGSP